MTRILKQTLIRTRGMALVVVLSLVVFLSLIVVSFVLTMRIERQAAHFYSEKLRADLLAREGVEYVKAAINSQTIDAGNVWISMPGRIVSWPNGLAQEPSITNLYSEPVAAAGAGYDFNRRSVTGDSLTAITGNTVESQPMEMGWIYVFEDGVRATDLSHQSTSPVVGRFAYWSDDETARIDLNTAWKQEGNPAIEGDLSRVNLLAINGMLESDADRIREVAQIHPFNSPDEARRLDANIAAILSASRFDVGYRAITPEANPWGEPKIFLTTQKDAVPAGETNFLDILTSDNIDPGKISNVSTAKLNVAVNRIFDAMKRTDWPYAPGMSFVDKFGERKAAQIALNIVEYVRSVESEEVIVEPVRAAFINGRVTMQSAGNEMVGNTRRPLINEIGVWVPPTPSRVNSAGNHEYDIQYYMEFHLPPNGGIETLNTDDLCVYLTPPYAKSKEHRLPAVEISKGGYGVASITEPYRVPPTDPRPSIIRVRVVVSPSSYLPDTPKRLDLAPMAPETQNHGRMDFPIDPPGVMPADINSRSIDDIYANKNVLNWTFGPNTLGAANQITAVGSPSNVTPRQDTDAAGLVSDLGRQFPNPKGTGNNPLGRVQSLRDLGFVHTGTDGYLENDPSVPWRTVRLQPQGASSTVLPDWALLELFRIPPPDASDPLESIAKGKVNLNSVIHPFSSITRTTPLDALLLDNENVPESKRAPIIQSITDLDFASEEPGYGVPHGIVSAGEIVELAGVADEGEPSENQLTGLLDTTSEKGNVFRVFSVGQSISQTPSGTLVVQAEKVVMAVVERIADETTGEVRSRVIGWRTLPL